MACKVEYRLAAGEGRRRRVIEKTVVEDGKVRTFFISLACNHCQEPACVKACPTGALVKDTDGSITGLGSDFRGIVLMDSSKCIGCRRCEWACPYGAPQYNPTTAKVHKCELCWQRIKAWKTAHPSDNPLNPTTPEGIADKRRLPACIATCLGSGSPGTINPPALAIGAVDPEVPGPVDIDSDGIGYMRPGEAGRGPSQMASYALTLPAVKVKPRVYRLRDGTVE